MPEDIFDAKLHARSVIRGIGPAGRDRGGWRRGRPACADRAQALQNWPCGRRPRRPGAGGHATGSLGRKSPGTESRNAVQPFLVRLLKESDNPGVRAAAMRGLAAIWDYECMPTMLDLLQDPSPQVRDSAAQAVAKLIDVRYNAGAPPEERAAAARRLAACGKLSKPEPSNPGNAVCRKRMRHLDKECYHEEVEIDRSRSPARFYPRGIARRHFHHRSADFAVVARGQSALARRGEGPSAATTSTRWAWRAINFSSSTAAAWPTWGQAPGWLPWSLSWICKPARSSVPTTSTNRSAAAAVSQYTVFVGESGYSIPLCDGPHAKVWYEPERRAHR